MKGEKSGEIMRSKFSPAQSSPANTDSRMGWVIPLSHMHEVLIINAVLGFSHNLNVCPLPLYRGLQVGCQLENNCCE